MRSYAIILVLGLAGCGENPAAPAPVPSPTATTPEARVFSISGRTCSEGLVIFEIPGHVRQVLVVGIFIGRAIQFNFRMGGQDIVRQMLGTDEGTTVYSRLHSVSEHLGSVHTDRAACGGRDLTWVITEVR